MPSATEFRRGFELEDGQVLGPFKLMKAHVGHEVVKQEERYSFPSTYEFKTTDGSNANNKLVQLLLKALRKQASGKKIVYSAYGSPYECTFGKVSVQDKDGPGVTITCKGLAVRRHDIPTKAQQQRAKEQQQAATGAPGAVDMKDPDVKRKLEAYRVIRSRFGSGHCGECGGLLQQGERIAKLKDDTSKGGWSHVACVVGVAARGNGKAAMADDVAQEGGGDRQRRPKRKQQQLKDREDDKEKKQKQQDEEAQPRTTRGLAAKRVAPQGQKRTARTGAATRTNRSSARRSSAKSGKG